MRTGIVVLILVCSVLAMGEDEKSKNKVCRILTMSGGNEKTAYHIGALKAMIEELPAEDVQYDVFAGVSFAALNAALMGTYEKGEE